MGFACSGTQAASFDRSSSVSSASDLRQRSSNASLIRRSISGQLVILARLFVDPSHRGHGAGVLLMLAAHTCATSKGLTMAFDTMLKDQAAIRLYETGGAKRLGVIEHHHSDDRTEPAAVYVAPTGPIAP